MNIFSQIKRCALANLNLHVLYWFKLVNLNYNYLIVQTHIYLIEETFLSLAIILKETIKSFNKKKKEDNLVFITENDPTSFFFCYLPLK